MPDGVAVGVPLGVAVGVPLGVAVGVATTRLKVNEHADVRTLAGAVPQLPVASGVGALVLPSEKIQT